MDLPCKPALPGLPDTIRRSQLEVVHPEQQAKPKLQDCDQVSPPVSSSSSLTKAEILRQILSVFFSGLANVGKPVSFVLDPHVVSFQAPRQCVPVAKWERLKLKIDEMVRDGKLAKVGEQLAWCSYLTVVELVKPDSSVKTHPCLDLGQTINKAIFFQSTRYQPWKKFYLHMACSSTSVHVC